VMWRDVGDDGNARRCFEQALSIQEEIGSRSFAALTYLNLGLALLPHDRTAARACYQKALDRAQATGNRGAEAYAWSYQATLHELEGDWTSAGSEYQNALAIRTELQAAAPAIEDEAGLARVALAQGRLDPARQHADCCVAFLKAHGVEGIEFPMQVYLTCYDVLQAAGDRDAARRMLEAAHALLLRRADAVRDPALREGMLHQVDANRRVLAEWEAAEG
jgi:tetratricopeptide (TPR) repeat protein